MTDRPIFPQGPGFTQERYIAAFEGLTRLMAAPNATDVPKWAQKTWVAMFNELTRQPDQQEDGNVSEVSNSERDD